MKQNSTRQGKTQHHIDVIPESCNRESVVLTARSPIKALGDDRLKARGFTLIELLVVVIIIAILAAIALPQYNKAVMKSRFAALKPIAKSVKDTQEIYFNREGHYAAESELGELDIAVPEGTSLDISATGEHLYVRANNPTGLPHNSYTVYFNQSENYAGNIYCEACNGDANAMALCLSEGGQEGPTNGDCKLYLLQGNSTGGFATPAFERKSDCSGSSCYFYIYSNGSTTITLNYVGGGSWEANEYDADNNLIDSNRINQDKMCSHYPFTNDESQFAWACQ